MSERISLTPQVVAKEIDVSSATLRRWSDEFTDYLSPEAGSTKGRSHRRYNDDDIATLKAIKALMNDGMTYVQVRQELADQLAIWADSPAAISVQERIDDDDDDDDDLGDRESEEKSLVSANGSEATAIEFFANTLTTLSDNQKSILNSQAANRELLGVLIQDNFNLKEENSRLRERLLEVERKMTQLHQEDEWRRESLRQELDAKIMNAQQTASEALTTAATASQETTELKVVQTKSGCLGALFGGGDAQIVPMPRRQERPSRKEPSRSSSPSASPHAPAPPHQPAPSPIHPKPTAPPE